MAIECSHPKCSAPIEGQPVLGRISKLPYCTPEHRYQDGCRRRAAANRDPEAERWAKIERKYGVTRQEWEDAWDRQLGRCAVCLTPLAEVKICTDHDHKTHLFRGLLCNRCNQGLGYFIDDAEILGRAVAYLLTAGRG